MIEERIKTLSVQVWGITTEDIESQSRKRELVSARFQAYFLIREYTDMSLSEIGRLFGGRDHSTVLRGLQQHDNYIKALKIDPKARIYQGKFAKLLELTGFALVEHKLEEAREKVTTTEKLMYDLSKVKMITNDAGRRLCAMIEESKIKCSAL